MVVVAVTVVVVCIQRVCIEKVVICLTVGVVCIEKHHQSNSVIVSHPKVMCVVYVTFLDIGYNNVPRRKIIVIITINLHVIITTIMEEVEVEVIFHEWRIVECR